MSKIENLFSESKGKPVEYLGEIIRLRDSISVGEDQEATLQFISTGSEWRQGVRIDTKGQFRVAGMTVTNALVLWEDTAPKTVNFTVHSQDRQLKVRNVWDTGNGIEHSWFGGPGMKARHEPGQITYHCNDGHEDDDFDDLVFRIIIPDYSGKSGQP